MPPSMSTSMAPLMQLFGAGLQGMGSGTSGKATELPLQMRDAQAQGLPAAGQLCLPPPPELDGPGMAEKCKP
eukprot:211093-Lingulodinium_polyedra.AAC.1